jgi:hypothetical protein
MILRTPPLGHRPRSCSSLPSMPTSSLTSTVRTVHLPSLGLARGLVVAAGQDNHCVPQPGQRCGHIELTPCLADAAGPVPLVTDLRITHECFGSRSNPSFNGTLHYPAPVDIDQPINDTAADKIRYYRADYSNRNSNSISFILPLRAPLAAFTVSLRAFCFCSENHRETSAFLQLQELSKRNTTRTSSASAALLFANSSH